MNPPLLRTIQQENADLKDEVSRLRDYARAAGTLPRHPAIAV
jgi:hypothetical protein